VQKWWLQSATTVFRPITIQYLEPRLLLTTYYLSPTGSDTNAGTSIALAWKTIARADQTTFHAGDSLLLQGGATFTGDLTFTATDTGTAASPISVSSFGSGDASISAGNTDGITITNTAGISISNLTIVGAGPTTNTGAGIDLLDNQTGQPQLSGISITNVSVSGFGFVGIGIGSTSLTSGFNNVSITDSTVYNDNEAGIFSYAGNYTANPAPYGLANSNIYVGHVIAYGNTGHSGTNDSGNGIELGNVNDATIERCVAYDNGASNVSTSGGPVGIWTYNSNDVTIQYNESYSNTSAHYDGDGFDLDGGVTNSVVQYNYSDDNAGAGYLEAQFAQASASSGNVIRYNISQDDGQKNNYPAIDLWSASSSDTISGTKIYGNTIFLTKPSGSTPVGIAVEQATTNVQIRNNIIDVASGLDTIKVSAAGTGLLIQGNDYWTGSALATEIVWGSTTYQTLAAFQSATGQEKNGSNATGLAVNPLLNNAGSGGTVTSADDLTQITAYQLQITSPLISAGVNLSALGTSPGSTDYYGNPLPASGALDIGADQVAPLNLTASSSASTFYLQASASGTMLDIWQNASTPSSGIPTAAVPVTSLSSINISANSSNTSLTIDFSNGDPFGQIPINCQANGTGNSLQIIGTAGNDTMLASTSQITFDTTPITYSKVQSIAINGNGGSDQLTQTAQPSAAISFTTTSSDTLTVQAGAYTFPAAAQGSGITAIQLGTLNISSSASVLAQPAGAITDRQLLELGSLNIAGSLNNWTGQLDLANNDLIVHNGNLAAITNMLAQGFHYNGKLWTGEGINSITAASDTAQFTSLGVILNSTATGQLLYGSSASLHLFDGVSPGLTDVLVKYTYYGDANLDGSVDGSDYSLIDNGFHKQLTGWINGDFNYEGLVDGSDYTLIDNAFNRQSGSLATQTSSPAAIIAAGIVQAPSMRELRSAMLSLIVTATPDLTEFTELSAQKKDVLDNLQML
jgi:hypothetical protein